MLENLIFSLNTVLPIFIVGFVGYYLVRKGVLSLEFANQASNACFKLFLPMMIFREVYNSKILEDFNGKLVVFVVVGIVAIAIIAAIGCYRLFKDHIRGGAVAHSIFRSNFVLLGIPILNNMYGDMGGQMAAGVLPFAVTTFNVCAVIIFAVFAPAGHGDAKNKTSVTSIAKSIVKNPFIIAIALGALGQGLHIELPMFLSKSVDNFANMASPLALLSVGAQFDFNKAKANLKTSLSVSFLRLVAVPLVLVSTGYMIGFRGIDLSILYVLFGAPTAVSGAALASSMGSDGQLTGEITLISSLLSCVSFFFGVLLLRAIGAV